ncbi:MAG: histidine kinase, partial [Bacteroidota bacterium]
SISDFIGKNSKQSADYYILKFAKLMRRVLEHSEQEKIPLSEDNKTLTLYLELESLRLNNKFNFGIKVESNIDIENTFVPPHLIQPFVENSIWHGIAKKEGNGHIIVVVRRENNILKCVIEDDGIGRIKVMQLPASGIKKIRKSFGINITRQRIDMLNGAKSKSPSLRFIDLPVGTRAEINVPVNLAI